MDRSQKADLVAELKDVFTETSVVVITRNLGLSVAQSTELRLKMRDAGAQFKVAKNRLEDNTQGYGKPGNIAEAGFFKLRQRVKNSFFAVSAVECLA